VALVALFCYYPILSAFYHALFVWEGSGDATWVGLANFAELGRDAILGEATLNLLKMLLVGMVVSLTLPLAAAEMIFHLRSARAQYFYRVLFVIPMLVPGVVVLLIWGFLYDYDLGAVNQVLRAIGLGQFAHAWLGEPGIALCALMFIGFPWIGSFALLVYFAGLQSIPASVLEAARVDGASGLTRIWHVDLPLIRGQIKLLLTLGVIGGVQGFQTQLILTQGGPGYSTTVPGLLLYQNSMLYDRMGYACAMGVVMFLAILALTYLSTRYFRSGADFVAR
jgi:ABC-type sugar transport system permease subunit